MATKSKKHPAARMTAKDLSNRDALQRINHEAATVALLQAALDGTEELRHLINFQYLPEQLASDIEDKLAELEDLLYNATTELRRAMKARIDKM